MHEKIFKLTAAAGDGWMPNHGSLIQNAFFIEYSVSLTCQHHLETEMNQAWKSSF